MKTLLSSIGIALAFLGTSSATVVVNYGSASYVTETTASPRASTSNSTTYSGGAGRSEVVAYSESIVFSPSSGYTGPVFYGGWYRSGDNATGTNGSNLRRIVDNASGDYINATFSYNSASNATTSEGAFAAMFLKADFTSLSTTPNLTFDLTNPLSMNINLLGKAEARWMVKDGSTYYISNVSYTTTGSKTLSSTDSTTWAVYDPFASLDFSSSSFASHAFTDIQGVGFYAQSNTTLVDTNASQIGVNSFTASVVPEPRAAILIGLGLVLVLLRRRTVALC